MEFLFIKARQEINRSRLRIILDFGKLPESCYLNTQIMTQLHCIEVSNALAQLDDCYFYFPESKEWMSKRQILECMHTKNSVKLLSYPS
jgi:hypothetical protein